MRFGVSTWFFQEHPIKQALTSIGESGFHAAEIWMEHLWGTDESPQEIASHAKELKMEVTLHSPFRDLNPISTNPGIRQESLCQIKQSILIGKQLGAKIIVVHPGHLSSRHCDVEKSWQLMEKTFAGINRWAKQQELIVGIEMMEKKAGQLYMLPEHIHRMLGLKWTNIGLTLDIAHAFTHMDPVKYIRQLNSQWIVHVHLSDGSRETTHLPLGEGEMNIKAVLQELDRIYDGVVMLEGAVPSQGQKTALSNRAYLQKLGWM